MKESGIPWIGEIPENWLIRKTSSLFSGIGSGTTPTSGNPLYYSEEGYNWLQTGDLNNNYINATSKKITNLAFKDFSALKLYPKDSIVIAMYGATIGKLGRLNVETATNQACCVLPKSNEIDNNFAFYAYWAGKQSLINLAYGAGQPNISQDIIKSFRIPVPPLAEQEQIASYLDEKCGEIDELIDVEQQMISDLESYRQAVITEAVTHGLNPSAPKKQSIIQGIRDIPSNWNEANLLKVIYLRARLGWRGLKADEYVDEGYPFLSAFNIVNNQLVWENLNFINQLRYDESPEIKLSLQDILIVKDGAGIGKCAKVENMPLGESTVNSSLGVITVSETLYYSYLYYFFLSTPFQDNVLFLKNGMGVPHLTQENLKSVRIPLPPVEEQKAIANYLDSKCFEIDELIKVKREKIETLKQYRQSLIFEAVTGKTLTTNNA